ncbi:hypothetical protein C3R44_24200, partial [Mycobacterium tuberculosis]
MLRLAARPAALLRAGASRRVALVVVVVAAAPPAAFAGAGAARAWLWLCPVPRFSAVAPSALLPLWWPRLCLSLPSLA